MMGCLMMGGGEVVGIGEGKNGKLKKLS